MKSKKKQRSKSKKTRITKKPRNLLFYILGGTLVFILLTIFSFQKLTNTTNVLGTATAVENTSSISNPIVYESTIQNSLASQELHDFKTSFVLRGTFQWGIGHPKISSLTNNIQQIKQTNPNILFEGGIGTQYLASGSVWPDGTLISNPDFNSMTDNKKYPYQNGYIPDLASPTYQKYLIGWGEKQIDAGVNGMFFDDPYRLAKYKNNYNTYGQYLFNNVVHVLKSYASGKNKSFFATINVGTCKQIAYFFTKYPYTIKGSDYITCSFESSDFTSSNYINENFKAIKGAISKVTSVPVIAFIDWPNEFTLFKNLSVPNQIAVLKKLYFATHDAGIYFAFPVFLSAENYDAKSAGTYSTMLELAQGKVSPTPTLPKCTNECILSKYCTSQYGYQRVPGYSCSISGDYCCKKIPPTPTPTPQLCKYVCLNAQVCHGHGGTVVTGVCNTSGTVCCKV